MRDTVVDTAGDTHVAFDSLRNGYPILGAEIVRTKNATGVATGVALGRTGQRKLDAAEQVEVAAVLLVEQVAGLA